MIYYFTEYSKDYSRIIVILLLPKKFAQLVWFACAEKLLFLQFSPPQGSFNFVLNDNFYFFSLLHFWRKLFIYLSVLRSTSTLDEDKFSIEVNLSFSFIITNVSVKK